MGAPQALRAPIAQADATLRGVAQVMLQDNRWTGLLFVLGLAWHSPVLALVAAPMVAAGLSPALAPVGLSVLTLPFVLVTWAFLLARPLFKVD